MHLLYVSLVIHLSEYCSNQQSPRGVLRSSQCEHLGVQYHAQEYLSSAMEVSSYYQNTFQVMSTGPNQVKKRLLNLFFWKSGTESQQPTPASGTHSDISQAVLAQRHQRVPVMQLLAAPLEVGQLSNCTWSNRVGATHWPEWAALEGCTSVSGHSLDAEAFLGPASCKRWCQLRLLSTVLTAEVWSDLAPRVAYVTNRGRQDS